MGIGEVGERLRRSTVLLRTGGDHSGCGSGIVWDGSGTIVTNAHVAHSGVVTVEFWDGRVALASLNRRDVRRDLAIFCVERLDLTPANSGDSSRVRVGEVAIAVGNPLGFIGALSAGVIHAVGRDFIQTTARLAPGNSGGPLADANGNVIGINTAVVSGGLGLAIPANAVGRLLTFGAPFELGVTVRPVRIPGANGGIGLLVLGITAGGAADYSSLRVGDLLIGTAGSRFQSIDDLRDAFDRSEGSIVAIQFLRGGDVRRREVSIRVKRRQVQNEGVAA